MTRLKRPLIVVDDAYRAPLYLVASTQRRPRPARRSSTPRRPSRQPRRVAWPEVKRRRLHAGRVWSTNHARRARRPTLTIVNNASWIIVLLLCAGFYGWLLWLLGGVALGWLAHVSIH